LQLHVPVVCARICQKRKGTISATFKLPYLYNKHGNEVGTVQALAFHSLTGAALVPEIRSLVVPDECTTLWGEPQQVHIQNMVQLHTHDCQQNVTEPQATCTTQELRVRLTDESTLAIFFDMRNG